MSEKPTYKELRILKRIANDASTNEVARLEGIAQSTVQTHLANIYSKLGVSSPAGAVAQALKKEWINVTDITPRLPRAYIRPLSEKEIKALWLRGLGYNHHGILSRMPELKTIHTVSATLNNARTRLQAPSIEEAVKRAAELGLFSDQNAS